LSKNSCTQKFPVFKANRNEIHSYCVRWAFWKQQLIPSEAPPPQPILKDLLYHHILHLQTMTSKCPHYLLTHIPIDLVLDLLSRESQRNKVLSRIVKCTGCQCKHKYPTLS
jgi:hypothetical protein